MRLLASYSVKSIILIGVCLMPMSAWAQASYISSTPKVGISVDADRSEANPGDDVQYWVRVRNLYSGNLPQWKVAFYFVPTSMQVIDSGGGRMEGDHVVFNVPASRSDEEHVYSIRVHLFRNLKEGQVLRTYGSMIWDGTISPACSKTDLRIVTVRPATGAGDNVNPVENLQAYLRPVNAAANGSPLPLALWIIVAIGGVALGGVLSKRVA